MPELRPPSLETLQRWMSLVIQHPIDSEAASHSDAARALIPRGPVVAGEIVKPNDRMTALRRLDVYNGGYLTRLIEVLGNDFDGVKHLLGEGWFEVAKDFVYGHPSHHPNLNRFGADFAGFLAEREGLRHRAFTAELARLQWNVTLSFDSPEFEPLDVEGLRSLTEEQWATATFRVNPSVRLLTFDYPVNRYLQGFFDGQEPAVPEAEPTSVLVYRKEGRVWRLTLPPHAAAVMAALIAGENFATALEAGAEHGETIGTWFQEWSADGVFSAVETA